MRGCPDAKTGSRSCVYKALLTVMKTVRTRQGTGKGGADHGCTDFPAVSISLAPTHRFMDNRMGTQPTHSALPWSELRSALRNPPTASSWLLSPKLPQDSEFTPQPAPGGPLTELGLALPTLIPHSGQSSGPLGHQGGFPEPGTSPQLLSPHLEPALCTQRRHRSEQPVPYNEGKLTHCN